MSQISVVTKCEKHQIAHRLYGASSKRRCPECERDAQLDRIERKLDALAGARRPDPRLAFIG